MLKKYFISLFFLLFFITSPLLSERPFFIITPPKSGSHLLITILSLATEKKSIPPSIKLGVMEHTPLINKYGNTDFILKIPSRKDLEKFILTSYEQGFFCFSHMGLSPSLLLFQKKHPEFVPITIIRDPRDMIVSAAYYFAPLIDKQYLTITPQQRITVLLNHYHKDNFISLGRDKYNGYTHLLEVVNLKYLFERKGLLTRFEELVGPKGGGSLELQKRALSKILDTIEIDLPIESFIDMIFGKNNTFRKGKIGEWKTHFTKEHEEIYKEHWLHIHEALGYTY